MISLLHPSRSRISKSIEATNKWIQRATSTDYEIIVSIDNNDREKDQYVNHYSNKERIRVIINDNRSAVDAINRAAEESKGEILMVLSDDTDCPNGWDSKILQAVKDKTDYVLKVYDGVQQWIVTMPVIDRAYYNRFGYLYPPDYKHMFVDTHFTHVAELTGKIIWRNDILFPHLHYSVGKGSRDEINERADASWNEGKAMYLKAFKEKFGLEVDPWNISNESHKKWLRNVLQ